MSAATTGSVPDLPSSGLRRVSLNPSHYRSGRWFLLGEGAVIGALGVVGIASRAAHPNASPTGVLAVAPVHGGLLLGVGVLAALACLHRRTAVVFTGSASVLFIGLVILGAVTVAHRAPGGVEFDARDILLHGVLVAANLALFIWLIPDVLEGPAWVRGAQGQNRSELGDQR